MRKLNFFPRLPAGRYAALIVCFASATCLQADSVLDDKGVVIVKDVFADEKGGAVLFFELKGKFVTRDSRSEKGRPYKAQASSPAERRKLGETWRLAGWTAEVEDTRGRKITVSNLAFFYGVPKGTFGMNFDDNATDEFEFVKGGKATLISFSNVAQISVGSDKAISVKLRDGTLFAGGGIEEKSVAVHTILSKGLPPREALAEKRAAERNSTRALQPVFCGIERYGDALPVPFQADLQQIRSIRFPPR